MRSWTRRSGRLLDDAALAGRLKEMSSRLQANPGTERAADGVESLCSRAPRARERG